MTGSHRLRYAAIVVLLLGACAMGSGCRSLRPTQPVPPAPIPPNPEIPRELTKISLPMYRIEPPDILQIEAVKIVPKAPYRIEPTDLIWIKVAGALLDYPIEENFSVDESGYVDLGVPYGRVEVVGLSTKEASDVIRDRLREVIEDPEVSVAVTESAGRQRVSGQYLVGPDGTVNLGTYGSVYITGMTIEEATQTIEQRLEEFLEEPRISLNIVSYNSKVYYVLLQGLGAGFGDALQRFPVTGNETVLDAIANVQGLDTYSSKRIWVARPSPDYIGTTQIMPVDWKAITQGASTATNFQIMPGDRIYVAEDRMIRTDNLVSKAISPFERAFGFLLLGTSGVQQLRFFHRGQAGGQGGGGGGGF